MDQEETGRFTISTRIYLTASQRDRLQQLVHDEGVDVAELLSELLADYLDQLPASTATEPQMDVASELRQRHAELNRVRLQQRAVGEHAPSWLADYIAELEAEIARLERLE